VKPGLVEKTKKRNWHNANTQRDHGSNAPISLLAVAEGSDGLSMISTFCPSSKVAAVVADLVEGVSLRERNEVGAKDRCESPFVFAAPRAYLSL
jgi:hypothetical protein